MTKAELELFLELYYKAKKEIERQLNSEYSNTSLKEFVIDGDKLKLSFNSGAVVRKNVRVLCNDNSEAEVKLSDSAILGIQLKQRELIKIINDLQRINDNLDKFIE